MQSQKSKNRSTNNFFVKEKVDITFSSLVLIILTIGLIMLFSASAPFAKEQKGDSFYYITKQVGFAVLGLAVMYIISRFNYKLLRKAAWPLYGVSILLLIAVLVLNPNAQYKRWLYIGPINVQVSEIAKFAIIVLFSHLIAKNHKKMREFKYGILYFMALLFVICALVVPEPHLSATILIFLIGITLMVVGGIRLIYIVLGMASGVAVAAAAILSGVVSYGSSRIQYWINPWAAPLKEGYQVIQSLLAIGSGGLMGRGIGESTQKYSWIPEPQNDFIFAVVCEELGFIGALVIIMLFVLLVWRGFILAMRSPDKFGALLTLGLVFQVGMQAVFNIAVVTKTVPNTGISLPFFSYGGTALLMLLAEMGIVLAVSRQSKVEKI